MTSAEPSRPGTVLRAAVVRILRPLVRILLRHGVSFDSFADLARRVYVEVAGSEEFRLGGRKQTVSRIAVLTGLTRKEVRRVADAPAQEASAEAERYGRAARVLAAWTSDSRFLDDAGEPRVLAVDGGFAQLVRLHSGDMPVRAVLDELARGGAVRREDDGSVRLLQRAWVPCGTDAGILEILGADVSALASTLDHNMTCEKGAAWFQRKVLYDNIPEESLPVLRALAAGSGQQLLEALNAEMRLHDRDTNPGIEGTGRRTAMVGVYYHECETADPQQESDS